MIETTRRRSSELKPRNQRRKRSPGSFSTADFFALLVLVGFPDPADAFELESLACALLSLLDVALDTLAVTGTRRPRTEAGSLELNILSLPSLSPSPAPLVALTFALDTRRTVGLDAEGLGAAILRCRNDDFYFGRN